MKTRLAMLAAVLALAAAVPGAHAGFVGWQAAIRSAGSGRCYVDVFAGFGAASDRLLNVYGLNVQLGGGASFVQGAAASSKWKAQDDVSAENSDDSFVTLGGFDGGDGHLYSSYGTAADPNFTNYTTAGAVTIPTSAGWYNADPTSLDIRAGDLLSTYSAWSGAVVQGAAASKQVWVGHFVIDRDIRDAWTLAIGGSAAFNSGTNATDTQTFVGAVAAPTNVQASDGSSAASVTVTWSASPGATGYRIFRDGRAAGAVGAATTFSDSGATPGTLHAYTVRASLHAGISEPSDADAGWRALSAPATVAASDGTATDKVVVSWAASSGAAGYEVYRALGSGTADLLATVGAVTQYADTGALPGISYAYSVRSIGPLGGSAVSAPNTGYRNLLPPADVAASDGTSAAGVTITWAAPEGATGYAILRSGSASPIATVGAVTTYLDATAVAGIIYTYTVRATGAVAGSQSAASAGDAGVRAYAGPASVVASDGAYADKVVVSWAPAGGAVSYRLFRDGAAAPILSGITGTSCSDLTALPGVEHGYVVRAVYAAGVSLPSASDAGYRNVAAPAGVAATDGTFADKVVVSWSAVTGATGYRVFRGATEVGSTEGTSFADTEATPGVSYSYAVRASGQVGTGAPSTANAGYRALSAPAGVSATDGTSVTKVDLSWGAVEGATGYKIYRDGSTTAMATVGAVVAYADTTAVRGVQHTYVVRASAATGLGAASVGETGYRNLAPPTGVVASDGTSAAAVNVGWAAVAGATGYTIHRTPSGGAAELAGTVGAVLTYADAGALPGVAYNYTVRATTTVATSAASTANAGFRNVAAPADVAATDGTAADRVTITWSAVPGATGYRVFRTGSTNAIATVGSVTGYDDASGAAGTQYGYTVKAVGAATGAVSTSSAANTGWRNRPAPTGVVATDTTPAKVRVTWNAVAGTPAATGYQVYRSIGGLPPVLLGSTAAATRVFDDTTIAPGVVGTYTVRGKFSLTGTTPTQTVVTLPSVGDTGTRPLSFDGSEGEGSDEGGAVAGAGKEGPGTADMVLQGGGRADEAAGGDASSPGNDGVADTGGSDAAAGDAGADPDAGAGAARGAGAGHGPDIDELLAVGFRLADRIAEAEARIVQAGDADGTHAATLDGLRRLLEPAEGAWSATGSGAMAAVFAVYRGDVNLDGVVDGADMAAFALAWATSDPVGADLDRDGAITDADLARVMQALGAL